MLPYRLRGDEPPVPPGHPGPSAPRPPAELHRPVLINSWEAAYFDFDAGKLVDLAREAAGLGVDLFVLDDGWFGARNNDCAGLGDWGVNEEKLSGGLAALIERIKALGMDFGIWVEPEMVNEDSGLYRAHPDWALGPADRPHTRGRSQLVLDFPHILIEGCAGGGGRFDGGMLYYTPQICCSDNTDAMDRLRIQYGTSFCYPVCTMGAHVSKAPNEQTGRVTPLETRGAVAMSGTFGYEMDLGRATPEERETIKAQVKFFKEHYGLIQRGDYYRLSDPFAAPYTAWEQVSPDKREALVSLVYSPLQANGPFRTLRMKGLDPGAVYQVNGGEEGWPGDVLMAAGYPLPLSMGDYQSVQLYLNAI